MLLTNLNHCGREEQHHELSQPNATSDDTLRFLHLSAKGPPGVAASMGPLSSLASSHISEELRRRAGGPQLSVGSPG